MDTDKSHHHAKDPHMNSEEWRKLTDDIEADITAKEKRLSAIASEKAGVISDVPKLAALEAEELTLPAVIESLKKRLPLLSHEREAALGREAAERYEEIGTQAQAAAAQVSASTQAILEGMEALLTRITEAHGVWQTEALLAAEVSYLSLRYALPTLQIPHGTRLTPEAQHDFARRFTLLLRPALNQQPWESLRRDFQDVQRREESQQREDEFKERSTGPHYQPIRTVQHAESR